MKFFARLQSLHLLGTSVGVACALVACGRTSTSEKSEIFPDRDLARPNAADQGVVLAWRAGTMPEAERENTVSVRDTLIVRVRNLDGWLIRMLEKNQISGEPAMSPDQRSRFLTLLRLQGSAGADAFLRNMEEVLAQKNRSQPTPGVESTTKEETPKTLNLPDGVSVSDLRDARIAYDNLLRTVTRQLFLVFNNSYFRQIKAENPDSAVVTGTAVGRKNGDTIHEFQFRVVRRPGDEAAWTQIYDGTRSAHPVSVSIGVPLDNTVFVLSTSVFPDADAKIQRVQLELFQPVHLAIIAVSLLIVLAGIVWLSSSTALIRDQDLPLRADGGFQFSLARIQLAFWTFLVVSAVLVIWRVTDRLDTLNTSILTLLGISSATTILSKAANMLVLNGPGVFSDPRRAVRRGKPYEELRKEIDQEKEGIEKEIRTTDPKDEARIGQLSKQLLRCRDDRDYLSKNVIVRFFIDLLSENGQVTIHRLQILIWTVLLGIIFSAKVMSDLAMPQFNETLLGLMGLSSLTYVALKVPELKKTQEEFVADSK